MEKAWIATMMFEYHVELQIMRRRAEGLDFDLELANQSVIDTQAYMDGNSIPLVDLVEEILDDDDTVGASR